MHRRAARRRPGLSTPPPTAGGPRAGRSGPAPSPAAYLTGRGCAPPHPEGDLRWHPDVLHWPSGWAGPALVALVTDPVTAAPMTLHLTFLRPDGSGKADLAPPRLYLPRHPKLGGVVRLWPDEEVTYGLCVAEGIETALTAALGFGLAWATPRRRQPDRVPRARRDRVPDRRGRPRPADPTGKRPGSTPPACARRWLAAGREVRLWKAPTEGADLNDYANGEAAA